MKYLDAGAVITSIYLVIESLGIGGCYCNPNVREPHQKYLKDIIGDYAFCGAFGIGQVEKFEKHKPPNKEEFLIK
jgi:nitroreductase